MEIKDVIQGCMENPSTHKHTYTVNHISLVQSNTATASATPIYTCTVSGVHVLSTNLHQPILLEIQEIEQQFNLTLDWDELFEIFAGASMVQSVSCLG